MEKIREEKGGEERLGRKKKDGEYKGNRRERKIYVPMIRKEDDKRNMDGR